MVDGSNGVAPRAAPQPVGRLQRWWRPVLAVLGLLLAAFFFVVYRQVLAITQKPSWPPTASAITAAGAQLATERFAARPDPKPADVGMPYAWSTAATIEPWPEGKNFFPRIFADIEQGPLLGAHPHVRLARGRDRHQARDLLVQKMKQGVEVRIIVDGQGSKVFGPAGPMFTRLADAGAQIVVNDLLPWDEDGLYPDHRTFDWSQDEVGHADHRKLYVIDGTVAWTGGAGIEDHFANGEFHDVMARVTGNVVRQAQALFLMSFRGHGGPLPRDLSKYFPAQPTAGTVPVALLQVAPGGFHVRDPGDPGADRPREDTSRRHEPVLHRRRHRPAGDRGRQARRQGADRRLGEVEQRAGDGGAQAPLRRPDRRRRADLGVPRGRRPREARGRRRHRRLRHRELRRLGALPELRGRDDGPQRRRPRRSSRSVSSARTSPVTPGHAADRPRAPGSRTGSGTSSRTSSRSSRAAWAVDLGRHGALQPADGGDSAPPASTADAATVNQTPQPALPPRTASSTRLSTGVEIITAAAPSTVTMPNHEPRERAPHAGERDQPEDDHQPSVVWAFDAVERDRPRVRQVPNTPMIASTIAARQIHASRRSGPTRPGGGPSTGGDTSQSYPLWLTHP